MFKWDQPNSTRFDFWMLLIIRLVEIRDNPRYVVWDWRSGSKPYNIEQYLNNERPWEPWIHWEIIISALIMACSTISGPKSPDPKISFRKFADFMFSNLFKWSFSPEHFPFFPWPEPGWCGLHSWPWWQDQAQDRSRRVAEPSRGMVDDKSNFLIVFEYLL